MHLEISQNLEENFLAFYSSKIDIHEETLKKMSEEKESQLALLGNIEKGIEWNGLGRMADQKMSEHCSLLHKLEILQDLRMTMFEINRAEWELYKKIKEFPESNRIKAFFPASSKTFIFRYIKQELPNFAQKLLRLLKTTPDIPWNFLLLRKKKPCLNKKILFKLLKNIIKKSRKSLKKFSNKFFFKSPESLQKTYSNFILYTKTKFNLSFFNLNLSLPHSRDFFGNQISDDTFLQKLAKSQDVDYRWLIKMQNDVNENLKINRQKIQTIPFLLRRIYKLMHEENVGNLISTIKNNKKTLQEKEQQLENFQKEIPLVNLKKTRLKVYRYYETFFFKSNTEKELEEIQKKIVLLKRELKQMKEKKNKIEKELSKQSLAIVQKN